MLAPSSFRLTGARCLATFRGTAGVALGPWSPWSEMPGGYSGCLHVQRWRFSAASSDADSCGMAYFLHYVQLILSWID